MTNAARTRHHPAIPLRPLRSALGRVIMVVATLAIALIGLVAVPPPAAQAAAVIITVTGSQLGYAAVAKSSLAVTAK
jgi:hypothetical protein